MPDYYDSGILFKLAFNGMWSKLDDPSFEDDKRKGTSGHSWKERLGKSSNAMYSPS